MNKTAIKNFAIWARVNLIESVKQKAFEYEIVEDGQKNNSSLEVIAGRVLSSTEKKQRSQLISEIKNKGYNQVMEEAAYTWFNRFIALRYMEVNGFLPSKVRVFSDEEGRFNPAILAEAMSVEIDGLDREKVLELLDKQDNESLYKMLIIAQCNALSSGLPYMFEKIENWTELLFPSNLLKSDSVVGQMVTEIPEEDWQDAVQIIGWMYQYYNSELKDETFALLKKNVKITKERIPAATQLFTPDWIVRYMVENSLGRLWVEGHPNDELKKEWKYYLEEAEQESKVEEELEKIRKEYKAIKPEEIKIIDPCMGSGHILVYAFDVLMQIYTSAGWSERDAAKSIVENNIYGLDIDDRAGQLAYFAVMMKARKYNRRILNGDVIPNVMAIQDSSEIDNELIKFVANGNIKMQKELIDIKSVLANAKEYGSILDLPQYDFDAIKQRIEEIRIMDINDIITGIHIKNAVNVLLPIVKQAQIMAQKYDIVVTNPPYMGGNGMSAKLSDYVKMHYPDTKSDMFAVFIEKSAQMSKMYFSMITQHSWMFLSSYENLRKKLQNKSTINMAHLGARAFDEIAGEVVQTTAFVNCVKGIKNYKGKYERLLGINGEKEKENAFMEKKNEYIAIQSDFAIIPGAPIAYWVSNDFMNAFINGESIEKYMDSFQGIITGDNNKFLRLWYELDVRHIAFAKENMNLVDLSKTYWIPYNKGGEFRKWYGNQDYVINWTNGPDDKTRGKKTFENYYLREYVSWSYITTSTLATRFFPKGFLWDVSGSGYFDKSNMLYYLQALLGSKVGISILQVINPTINYQVENILQVPVIVDESRKALIDEKVKENIEKSKEDWDAFEESWEFKKHPLV